jgi:hypothetical protein
VGIFVVRAMTIADLIRGLGSHPHIRGGEKLVYVSGGDKNK